MGKRKAVIVELFLLDAHLLLSLYLFSLFSSLKRNELGIVFHGYCFIFFLISSKSIKMSFYLQFFNYQKNFLFNSYWIYQIMHQVQSEVAIQPDVDVLLRSTRSFWSWSQNFVKGICMFCMFYSQLVFVFY